MFILCLCLIPILYALWFQSSILTANAQAQVIQTNLDAGSPPGTIKGYTGSAPAATTSGATGTLLTTLTFSSTSFGSASAGVITANTITSDTSAANSGTLGYIRFLNAAGTCICQVSVGTSGADINFNSLSIVAGGTVAITSLTITQPQGP